MNCIDTALKLTDDVIEAIFKKCLNWCDCWIKCINLENKFLNRIIRSGYGHLVREKGRSL